MAKALPIFEVGEDYFFCSLKSMGCVVCLAGIWRLLGISCLHQSSDCGLLRIFLNNLCGAISDSMWCFLGGGLMMIFVGGAQIW